MGIRDRDYMRRAGGETPYDDRPGDDQLRARMPVWGKILLVVLALALVAVAIVNNI
ncbi:MAG: hypothetical protein U1E39_13250 [Planctomycetota bacterium]